MHSLRCTLLSGKQGNLRSAGDMGRQRFYCCRFFAWRACPLLFLIVQVMAYSRIAQADGKGSYTGDVRKLCGYTRFPDDCLNSLTSRRLPTAGTYDYALVAFALVGEITEKMGSGAPMFSLKAATNARTQEAIGRRWHVCSSVFSCPCSISSKCPLLQSTAMNSRICPCES